MNDVAAQERAPLSKNTLALQEKLSKLLAASKPSKRELTLQCFRDVYPAIEAHMSQGKALKEILLAFNELAQAKVCLRTFSNMLKEERDLRDDGGRPACCEGCGRPLFESSAASGADTGRSPHTSVLSRAIDPEAGA